MHNLSVLLFYLWPVLAQVALIYLVAALILVTRLGDLAFGAGTAKFYEDYAGIGGPPLVQRSTRLLANQFEFPVLFFVLIGVMIATGSADPLTRLGAWIFVVGRWVHALVQLFANRLWLRTPVFMISNLALFAMWARLTQLGYGALG
jgi:hypothetical protein